jgi:hypothetical protein
MYVPAPMMRTWRLFFVPLVPLVSPFVLPLVVMVEGLSCTAGWNRG